MKAEIKWVIENEMAETIEDVLARRIRLLFLDAKAAMESAPVVAEMFALLKGKDRQWQKQQIEMFCKLAEGYLINFHQTAIPD
jgi:glycerol-3-phosphate dehydrogenase